MGTSHGWAPGAVHGVPAAAAAGYKPCSKRVAAGAALTERDDSRLLKPFGLMKTGIIIRVQFWLNCLPVRHC